MTLRFKCPNCLADIVVQYLKPGEEALCRSCGIRAFVPSEAEQTDAVPDYGMEAPEPSEWHGPLEGRDLTSVLARRRMRALVVTIAATAAIFLSLLPTRLGAGNVLLIGALCCGCTGIATYVMVGRTLKLRDREFKEAGTIMGLEYAGASMAPGDGAFGRLPLFAKGSRREMIHVLVGPGEWVFDYEYKLGYRRPKKSHTVAVFELSGDTLPRFRLHPEAYFDRIDAALGFQDINFAEDLMFSEQFRLRSKKEDLARHLFGASLRGELSRFPGLSFEGDGKWLAIYTRVRCKIEDIANFISDTEQLACAFAEAARQVRW